MVVGGGAGLEARGEPVPSVQVGLGVSADGSNFRVGRYMAFYAPRDGGDDLAAHHLGEGLELGGVVCSGDGVEGVEGGGRCFGLEIDHVHDCADAGVGGECLHHEVCVWVFVWVGLVLDNGGEERGQVVERVALDASPHLLDWIGRESKRGDDAWTEEV